MKPIEYLQTSSSFGCCDEVPEQSIYTILKPATSSSLIDTLLIYPDGNNTSKFQIEHFKNADFWFSNTSSLELKKCYLFQEDKFNDVMKFISNHQLADFLLWIHEPIVNVFGNIKKSLNIFRCWDEEDDHLVLTICSSLDDMDEMMILEEKLFEILKNYHALDSALHHIVITQD